MIFYDVYCIAFGLFFAIYDTARKPDLRAFPHPLPGQLPVLKDFRHFRFSISAYKLLGFYSIRFQV